MVISARLIKLPSAMYQAATTAVLVARQAGNAAKKSVLNPPKVTTP